MEGNITKNEPKTENIVDMKIVTMTLHTKPQLIHVTGDHHIPLSVRSKPCLPVCFFPVDGFVEDDPPVTSEQCVSDS